MVIFRLKMVIFHSYVSLPKSNPTAACGARSFEADATATGAREESGSSAVFETRVIGRVGA